MARTKLSPPWEKYYKEVCLMFEKDKEVAEVYNPDTSELKLYVDNPNKAEALARILPEEKVFGDVRLKITVIPSNGTRMLKISQNVYEAAFENNPIVNYISASDKPFCFTYIVFVNTVVQYFNDNIGDVNGFCSTLYQEIAKDVFKEESGVFWCTDKPKFDCMISANNRISLTS